VLDRLVACKRIKLDNKRHHWASIHNIPPQPGDRPFKRPRLPSKGCMDPALGSSNSTSSRISSHGHPPRTSSTQSVRLHGNPSGSRSGKPLSRGHSDGDVLDHRLNERRRTSTESSSGERETWMDFINSSGGGQDATSRAQLVASRAAMMAADRRKRIAEYHEEHSRRRASSGLSLSHPPGDRSTQGSTQTGGDHPFIGPPPPPIVNSMSTPSIVNRPLPRPPSIETSRDRRSRDIVLPKWQSDTEVSKCPICGTAFGFWYRKHHCRKCGRVVCANCSPHRITIPRQFIVHPPEEAAASPTVKRNSGIEVVDLTGDNDSGDDAPHSHERPQSSDYKIDPALGGGQEVRLCNPCVPDPNPLPHLPFSPPSISSFDSFHRPDRVSSRHHRSSLPGLPSSEEGRRQNLWRQTSSGHSNNRHDSISRLDGSMASRETFDYPDIGPSTNRRHSHAPRPGNATVSPPGYASIYGSAPDQTAPQVNLTTHIHHSHTNISKRELAAFLHEHVAQGRHRHYASMSNFPTQPRHRPLTGHDMPRHHPAPPTRPQLREEDECPVCHQALPPKGPNNSEVAREAHVQSCIETHFSSSGPRSSNPPPAAAPSAAVAASAATPAQAAGPRAIPAVHRASVGNNDMPSASFQQRRRVAGMVTYHASEKDCVGEDGEGAQECVICFEEFAVGEEMGRLECLCKYHKVRISLLYRTRERRKADWIVQACIIQWWETKGPGACPVHQEGT